jgi:hypothetical protein
MLVLALAPSSFAQVQVRLFNATSSFEVQTNRNAQTADPASVGSGITVTGELVAISNLTTTRLRLTFPAPITSSPAVTTTGVFPPGFATAPPTDAIRIDGGAGTGLFASVTAVTTVDYTGGTIDINLPGVNNAGGLSGSLRLLGVRIDANGKTAPLTVSGALQSTANNYFAPTETPTLISALGPGITGLAIGAKTSPTTDPVPANNAVPSDGTATVFTNRTVSDNLASFIIVEGNQQALRTATQSSSSGVAVPNGTNIRLTFNNVPANLTLTLTCSGSGSSTAVSLVVAVSNGSITSTNNTSNITVTGTSLTRTETLDCRIALPVPAGGQLGSNVSLSPGAITVTATLIPIGDALDTVNTPTLNFPTVTGGYPRFAQADLGPLTIINIVAANTTFLLPYASKTGPFDTGIALANTTADPFGVSGGGQAPAAGNCVLTFFPRTTTGAGTSSTLTTSATVRPGTGLGTDGTLAAGGTWTVNVSELLPAATPAISGDYFGYIFVVCNFPAGHGISFIYNGAGFTSFSPLGVMNPPAAVARTSLNAEFLGF